MTSEINSHNNTDKCAICWDPLTNGTELKALHPEEATSDLQHIFHKSCIDTWVTRADPTCPFCHRSITTTVEQQIDAVSARLILAVREEAAIRRGEAILRALGDHPHADAAVPQLLAHGPIPEPYRGLAVRTAISLNLNSLVTQLLASGPISIEDRGKAVNSAACGGKDAILIELLASGPISAEDQDSAITIAITNKHFSTVDILFPYGLFALTEKHRGAMAYTAIDNFNEEEDVQVALTEILASGPISEYYRGEAVRAAVRRGYATCVEALLANGPISEEYRGYATASAGDKPFIMARLLANGPISQIKRDTAVDHMITKYRYEHLPQATERNYKTSISQLLAHGPLSEKYQDKAILSAIQRGEQSLVIELLANGPISNKVRSRAVMEAARTGHLRMVPLLLGGDTLWTLGGAFLVLYMSSFLYSSE